MKIRVAFVIGEYPAEERQRREQVALSYATPEIEIGILSTAASPYIRGMSPTDIQMAAPLFIEAFREAERQRYDAVVPLGMLDLGIDGGKSEIGRAPSELQSHSDLHSFPTRRSSDLAAPLFIEAFREAERQRYDAVVPLGMLDLGIDGGKS